ncbi:retrotransposon protein, putative, ty1-copia subclass [Tanacetum coccineum]
MKGYVEQLERLGYVLPQDLSVGLILNGLTSYFAGFARNYNMLIEYEKCLLNMKNGELHVMLIEYEKCLPKKAKTPQGKDKQVYIPTPKNPKPSAKEHPAKDDACHHCKEVGHWKRNCPMYLAELLKKKKQVGSASSSGKMTRKSFPHRPERVTDLLGIIYTEEYNKIPMEVEGFEPPQEEEILIRRSEKTRQAPNRLCLNVEAEEHSLEDLNEPTSYKSGMLDSESNKWIDAMNAEIQSMMDNMVWVLVDLPPGYRLVAKGYTQLYGVDYEETFSPVADIRAIRILISIAAYSDYEICQMDIKTAFLNGYLDEDIYMQASRSWNKIFDEEIKRFGFAPNLNEPCVYQKASGSNVTFLILYVDDIIIMGNHIPSLQSVKDYLGKCFAMKDLREAAFIFRIKIYKDRSKRLIGLGQNAYMDKILKRYRMDNSKLGHIPMQERLDLNKTQGASTPEEVKRMQNVPYASVVGSIMYVVRCTRHDVAFSQNITSHFQQNPGECHWTTVKNILKYLRNTKYMFLVYGGNPEAELRVDCYCDVGFETDRDDTKSQTGYVFILNGGAVDWKSFKQSTTATFATEAGYIAASEAAMEAV